MNEKTCTQCEQSLPTIAFSVRNRSSDGLMPICKACQRTANKRNRDLRKSKFKGTYIVWMMMKNRCNNPNHEKFHRYGGRGISVCREWLKFDPFFKWCITNGYDGILQLDRKNNDGNYEPGNCRFVTRKTNVRNSTVAKLTESDVLQIREKLSQGVKGVRLAEIYGVSRSTIWLIKQRRNWCDVI